MCVGITVWTSITDIQTNVSPLLHSSLLSFREQGWPGLDVVLTTITVVTTAMRIVVTSTTVVMLRTGRKRRWSQRLDHF